MATYYWVNGSGTWDGVSTANWSASTGGANGAGPPLATDNVIFDANSGTGTCTTASGAASAAITLNSANLTLKLGQNLTATGVFTLTLGSVLLETFTLTATAFSSSNSNARAVNFGTGKIVVTGSGSVWNATTYTNLTILGTPVVDVTYSGATAVSIASGLLSEGKAPSFNIKAGTYTLTINSSNFMNDLNFTGFKGTWDQYPILLFGGLTLDPGMTVASGSTITFGATSGIKSIITNGIAIDRPVNFNGAGGNWRLEDDLTIGSTRNLTLTYGTLNASGKNVSLGNFVLGSGTKTLTLGSGVWTVNGTSWNANTNVSGLTVSASTGVINMVSASAKTFFGGGKTWPTLNQGGTGELIIQQSNTFTNITNTVQPATITLTAGNTQTVSAFGISGTSGNLITLNSSVAGSQATLSDSSGTNTVSFVSIKDINATGGAIWDSPVTGGNVDAGNNIGWNFGIPFGYDIEFSPSLRSFTERKHF